MVIVVAKIFRIFVCFFSSVVIFLISACSQRAATKSSNFVVGLNTKKITEPVIPALSQEKFQKINQYKITTFTQSINDRPIYKSFIKRIYTIDDTKEAAFIAEYSDHKIDDSLKEIFEKKDLSEVKKQILKKYPQFNHNKWFKLDWIYYAFSKKITPVYLVKSLSESLEMQELILDHKLNQISSQRVGSCFSDVLVKLYPRGPKLSTLENVTLKNVELGNSIKNQIITVNSSSNIKTITKNEILSITPDDPRFDLLQVSYFLQNSFDWFEKEFTANIPLSLEVELNVGAPEKTNTFFYYSNKIRFGSGDEVYYAQIAKDPSIIIHEGNHALIDKIANLPFQNEGGSINEGFADFLTTLQLNNPNLGEVAYLKGPFKRTVKNSAKLSDKKGSLYGDSSIVSGLFWQLKEELGDTTAGKLAVDTLILLGPKTNFKDLQQKINFIVNKSLHGKTLEQAQLILNTRGW
ncbi:MAG: hypothetical protein L6Q37_00775 [Bdellovibrionaceae bacterium]|nr:hypothetical protein [Pseudobdellovibrionaceae bacterium]NUM57520.1 hypothetical protein [Pseudobdellovibrionaceae bacterium]